MPTCSNCNQECKPLRCTACRLVSYCSRECQRLHWKAVHSKSCTRAFYTNRTRKNRNNKKKVNSANENDNHDNDERVKDDDKVLAAARELNYIVSNMSTQQLNENYYKSIDHIRDLEKLSKNNEGRNNDNNRNKNINNEKEEDNVVKTAPSVDRLERLKEQNGRNRAIAASAVSTSTNSHNRSYQEMNLHLISTTSSCDFMVEKLVFTGSYNVTIRLSPSQYSSHPTNRPSRENVRIQVQNYNYAQAQNVKYHDELNNVVKSKVLIQLENRNESINRIASIALPDYIVSSDSDALSSLAVYYDDAAIGGHRNDNNTQNQIYLVFRLKYHVENVNSMESHIDASLISNTTLTDVNALNCVECRFCNQYLRIAASGGSSNKQGIMSNQSSLLPPSSMGSGASIASSNNEIKRVCHLPNGYWDEITDYLSCYEGQATVNFSSSNNKIESGVVYEDESIIVMNKQDLHNVCILAIEGYGEQDVHSGNLQDSETGSADDTGKYKKYPNNNIDNAALDVSKGALFRGKRAWCDAVGGATVCCNLCCSILGYASLEEPDSCRLLKHRLRAIANSADEQSDGTKGMISAKDYFSSNTCATFIGRELARYAESQAVFTFIIFNGQSSDSRVLLLKLLSWNTIMRISNTSRRGKNVHNNDVRFRRIAKVIYEEIDNQNHRLLVDDKSDGNDPIIFSWGSIDLCCPPSGGRIISRGNRAVNEQHRDMKRNVSNVISESKACVQIHLPEDEWIQLREALREGNDLIPNVISDSTVMLKLGNNDGLGAALSILQLPQAMS